MNVQNRLIDFEEDQEAIRMLQSLVPTVPAAAPIDVRSSVLIELGLADRYFTLPTVLGDVYIAYNSVGISTIESIDASSDFEAWFLARFGRRVYASTNPPKALIHRVELTLHGEGHSLPELDLRSVRPFQRDVLLKALEIPFGQIRPYGWVAQQIGRPKAVRAVGTALATNPIPLVIPCHRVVRSDGVIGNYGMGGTENKKHILAYEGVDTNEIESLARRGIHYYGSDTTHIYCFPTCRYSHRLTDKHRMYFHSVQQAKEMGYRACKVCKPEA